MSKPPLSLASHFLPFIAAAIGRGKTEGTLAEGLYEGLLRRWIGYYFQLEKAGGGMGGGGGDHVTY